MMENLNFSQVLFLIEVMKIAQSKGFELKIEDDFLYVKYPTYGSSNYEEVNNLNELIILCNEIIKWK